VHRAAWLTASATAPSTEPYVGTARFARPAHHLFHPETSSLALDLFVTNPSP
jgi:hypothetical protein